MSDAGIVADGPNGARADTLAGDVVRDLFAQHEREIESLLDELAVAHGEADAVEARIRVHPALGLLSPEERQRWSPVPDPQGSEPAPRAVPPRGPVRTTVDHRPRRPVASGASGGADAGLRAVDGADAPPSRAPLAVRYRWAWMAGVVVAVVGLLLLKFG